MMKNFNLAITGASLAFAMSFSGIINVKAASLCAKEVTKIYKRQGKYLTQVGFTSAGHAVYAQEGKCINYGKIPVGQNRSKTTGGVKVIVKRYNNHVSVTWINPKYAPFTAKLR